MFAQKLPFLSCDFRVTLKTHRSGAAGTALDNWPALCSVTAPFG